MSKIAFIFPGQGAQSSGMGVDLYNNYDSAKKVFDTANVVLDKDIKSLCFDGPDENLKQTVNTQPCIVTTSIAALEALKSQLNIKPDYVAGHSLGEYCAMYAADVMTLEQTLKAIQKRAALMSAVQEGSMAAVMKATDEQLQDALKTGSKIGYVDVANYNSPQQVVITGDDNAIKAVMEYLAQFDNVRVVPLAISGAFHSKYLKDAGENFDVYISDFELNNAKIPVITNVDAQPTTLSKEFKDKMPKQMYSSVYWAKTIEKMWQDGVRTFIEIGPGKVLTNLNKRMLPSDAKLYNVFDKESLNTTVTNLNKEI